MEENDLPLLVPLTALTDYLQCSICMCSLDKTTITVCGHRYCEKCISEWVGRQHTCPCCNHPLILSQLFKDHQFDSLISAIESEKSKAETQYFENLIQSATSENSKSSEQNMSPVELVLKKHLKKGLIEHESYLQTLKKSLHTKMNVLETSTERAVADLQSHGLSQNEVLQQTQDLYRALERQKLEMTNELESCVAMVAEAYDRYLNTHIPRLDVLPVKATVVLAGKNISIPDITFQATDSLLEVRTSVESAMIKRHNPVHSWEPSTKYYLFGPFAKCSELEMRTVIHNFHMDGNLPDDVQFLTEGAKLGLQYNMRPGSVILILDGVKLESDLPKKCFVDIYKKSDTQQKGFADPVWKCAILVMRSLRI
ncbi:E3 ubiquitin-protein ligase TRIM21-like isoform X2 [Dreissena polymorpha]|uniref:E3 ubiquitin-protein ligase TRIM21-like isoform X2 n=1 Tax=Dreissena polymorpha TaxID=45954 RepID=UPI00226445E8|nr:E3 ubiquitin-protein ligase TRIM21-like isoform X2 [Dreissena polymorpha]